MRRPPAKTDQWADHYTQKAKKDRFPARSVYKLQEIQRRYRLIGKGNKILDLGCFPGSWLLYAADLVGKNGQVVGVDLKTVSIKLPANTRMFTGSILDPDKAMETAVGPGYFFYAHDTEGIFTYISPSTKTVTGYTEEEFLKHYQTYLTDNPINKETVRHTNRSLAGEQQPPYEVEMIHKDGHNARLEVSEIPIFNTNGDVIAVEGICQDITPRIQADDTLHTLVESMVGLTGQAYFDKVTCELCRWFDADAAYIGRLTDGNQMETLSMVLDGENLLEYRYRLEGTPCQAVVDSGTCFYIYIVALI